MGRPVAIVTGASQGIGQAIAARLAADGFDLALLARREDALREVAGQLEGEHGGGVLVQACDVADEAQVQAAVEATKGRFDRVDALVNNAGITRDGILARMDREQWRQVMAVNLDGAYYCLRAVTPIMMRARSGRIVNISSVVGLMGNAGQANYAASKAGLLGLTRSAARELAGRNVTVNAIAPGFIETEMTRDLPEKAVEKMVSQIPQQRLGQAADVAAAVSFLLSGDASYITGQVLNVDGGMVMG